MIHKLGMLCFMALLAITPSEAFQKKKKTEKKEPEKDKILTSSTFSGLKWRLIGPALTEGRISDMAVNPNNPAEFFIAVASGGVWQTENNGVTWKPVFDRQGSYSVGCIALDPNNPLTVWVGTGENNSQRSVGYGDGVYKSVDNGKTWKNMGLKNSEHIGMIVVDPRDANVVYVASQGPLWSDGGDRGLYKTTDGGESWSLVLEISERTGVSEVILDPRNPDIIYASAYQRRRHVWTLINGGPESGIHKSEDGGKSWRELKKGLPGVDMGRIGLALAPGRPDTIYAIVEAAEGKSGFFRSTNRGESWEKQSDYVSNSPQYYQEIIVDPKDPDVIYSNDTFLNRSEDGGKSFQRVGEEFKHVDNHVTWIDPDRTDHLLVGCDGGLYESFDRAKTWLFRGNLPITQFYKIDADNDLPFYNVYGGTQDNFTLGGPSQTTNVHGIRNSDWFVTHGGDGFQPRADPEDPNTVYAQSQHGNLARYNRETGEEIDIQPQAGVGDPPLRWNWDSPLIISPHSTKRLYFAANVLFRSDDQGNSWRSISGDLSRNLDRNKLKVMGQVWGVDSVSKNRSTSFYGNIVSLSESPIEQDFLVAGTDDGLIQITADSGANWTKLEKFPGVPDRTYVVSLNHSRHEAGRIYAGFNNHKMGDFKPYLLRSDDRGKTWVSIVGDLPERGSVYDLAEDPLNPELLFVGTEFGAFFTLDGGKKWIELSSGLPTIAVRDLVIQERENDLIAGTFGRGIYIIDDYSPIRDLTREKLEKESLFFAVKDAWRYIPDSPLGGRGNSFQGDALYAAENPDFGAVFTYYLPETIKTRKAKRQEAEKEAGKDGGDVFYPSWEDLRLEDREEKPSIILTVKDAEGSVVSRIEGGVSKGFHRVAWDLRLPAPNPPRAGGGRPGFRGRSRGPLALPGAYTVSIARRVEGVLTEFGEPQTFNVAPLYPNSHSKKDQMALYAFQKKLSDLMRAMLGADRVLDATAQRMDLIQKAIINTPDAEERHAETIRALKARLQDIRDALSGDDTIDSRYEPTPPSIMGRAGRIAFGQGRTSGAPTETQREAYQLAGAAFEKVLADLKTLVETDLKSLEDELESVGAPWTPGRIPTWNKD